MGAGATRGVDSSSGHFENIRASSSRLWFGQSRVTFAQFGLGQAVGRDINPAYSVGEVNKRSGVRRL